MKSHRFLDRLAEADFATPEGYVSKVAPGFVAATGPAAALGDICEIGCETDTPRHAKWLSAEVVAVDTSGIVLVPLKDGAAVRLNARVVSRPRASHVPIGDAFAGRAVNALGEPIDGRGQITPEAFGSLQGEVPRALDRRDPSRVFVTGIRAIDGLLTLGIGQRIGVFAASGVGKTSLIEQIALQTASDRCVVCLVGERGREVEAVWRLLSDRKDAARFTLVAATSDESAALRARSVLYALSLADYWRARGEHVFLIVDSVTRVAMALREIGLAAGAPPTVRAYTPNVFSALPRIVERCGAVASGGATTAVMTVLSETDDVDDPIVELMKSLLDGHIVLSRLLAEQGHFPAIDVARSVSRQAARLVSPAHESAMREAIAMLASYEESRVMIESGVYSKGSNAIVDRAIEMRGELKRFLSQPQDQTATFGDTVSRLVGLIGKTPRHA